jgi:hypothetical protein
MRHKDYFQLVTTNAGWFRKPTAELCTTEMPKIQGFDLGYAYESCLFVADDSEVLARYQFLSEAIAGHKKLCQELNLKTDVK